MKKTISLLCAGLVSVGAVGMAGCNLFNKEDVPGNDTVIEQYFDVGSVDFKINQNGDLFYPTLTGFFNTNIDYDKITVTCADKETDLKFIETSMYDGKMLQFNQVLLFDLLMPEEYDVKFTVYDDGWKYDVDSDVTLKPETQLTLSNEDVAMKYKTEWYSNAANGLSVLAKNDNTITLNGSKKGVSTISVKVYPFTLEPGTYNFKFTVSGGSYVNVNTDRNTGFTVLPIFPEDNQVIWSSPHAKSVGDTYSITYVVGSRVTVDRFYIDVPNDTSTFTDVVINWTF